jgi:hypothetical protein
MRKSALVFVAAAGVCLAFGLSATSAQRAATGVRPAATRADVPVADDVCTGCIGPGYGGGRLCGAGSSVRFLGVTSHTFPVGVGALTASRACNDEFPNSRLCEWKDIFRPIPPVTLDTEVLVAPNYETNPVPACLTPAGGLRCGPLPLMRPAACCGVLLPFPPPPSLALITLTPSTTQAVNSCADTFNFTAIATDLQGTPLPGIPISFAFPPVVGGTQTFAGMDLFTPSNALTDANGEARTTLTFNPTTCASFCFDPAGNCTALFSAHDASSSVFSNSVTMLDNIQ